jgi:hypothetical protein
VLNDGEVAALELAEQPLRSVTTRCRLVPGNIVRLASVWLVVALFDLVVAGGLFDYLLGQLLPFCAKCSKVFGAPGAICYLQPMRKIIRGGI